MATPAPPPIDRAERACIVGAGPAGLSQARAFRNAGIAYDQFERHGNLGGIWDIDNPGTPMYESAHLISSRTLSGFFDFPMADDAPDYPSHARVLAYLRAFARAYGLAEQIAFGTAVERAEPDGAGWLVGLSNGERRRYGALVCANGMTWEPHLPELPGRFDGELRHAVTYRGAAELASRRVLILGGGNTGCDIACDAAESARAAFLSLRRGYRFVPKYVFGMPADVFAAGVPWLPLRLKQWVFQAILRLLLGDLGRYGLPRPDHRIYETHPILNSLVLHHLSHGDLTAKPDVQELAGDRVVFTDGSEEAVDLILLATGYAKSFPFLDKAHFEWAGNRPKNYLSVFSPGHDTLFTLGFIDTNAGVYEDFDRLAHMVANFLRDRERDPERAAKFSEMIRTDRPDLTGGVKFVASPRHACYVHHPAFRAYLDKLTRKMGWPPLAPGAFDGLRVDAGRGQARAAPAQPPPPRVTPEASG